MAATTEGDPFRVGLIGCGELARVLGWQFLAEPTADVVALADGVDGT